jgi:hypothetical protein
MVQAIVERPAFHFANQYLTENRVQIIEADDLQISAVVIGNSGVYEQTVRLKDGSLGTKCSCSLDEEPFCRHTVAVLLEYHRWSKPTECERPAERRPETAQRPQGPAAYGGPVLDIKLSEATLFIEWFESAAKALEEGRELPPLPDLGTTKVRGWIQLVRDLEERRRRSEEKESSLKADLREREDQLGRISRELQTAGEEAREAQTAAEQLRQELATYQSLLTRLIELAKTVDRFDSQLKALTHDLLQNTSQLSTLGGTLQEVSSILQDLGKHPS